MRPPTPLVSCLLVTRDRPGFARLAIRWFARQTWARRELILVEGGDLPPTEPSGADLGGAPARVVHAPGMALGPRRNLAMAHARGEVLVSWDDDDWFAPQRLADQVHALASAELCALRTHHVLDLAVGVVLEPIRRRPGPAPLQPAALGTLAWWRDGVGGARFGPDVPGEDRAFFDAARRAGARACLLPGIDRWAQGQHPGSTSPLLGRAGRPALGPGRRPRGMGDDDLAALVAAARGPATAAAPRSPAAGSPAPGPAAGR